MKNTDGQNGMTWTPIDTAPRDGRKFIVWDGWQQALGSYEHGRFLITHGAVQDTKRPSEWTLWHPLPNSPERKSP